MLAAFAEKRGITYNLLADEGSKVIRALGLYNDNLEAHHAQYGIKTRPTQLGVAYPGTFVLDEKGIVVDKEFEQSYRVRPTAAALLQTATGHAVAAPVSARGGTEQVQVEASIDSPSYRPYEKLVLRVRLNVAPGLHVYAAPVPDGYAALAIDITGAEDLQVEAGVWPTSQPFEIEGLDEKFLVYASVVEIAIPFLILKAQGDLELTVRTSFQACSETICYPPVEVSLALPLQGLDNIRD